MAIKAEDVRKVSFDQAKRGYDTEQVDAFLEEVEQPLRYMNLDPAASVPARLLRGAAPRPESVIWRVGRTT